MTHCFLCLYSGDKIHHSLRMCSPLFFSLNRVHSEITPHWSLNPFPYVCQLWDFFIILLTTWKHVRRASGRMHLYVLLWDRSISLWCSFSLPGRGSMVSTPLSSLEVCSYRFCYYSALGSEKCVNWVWL